jgi:hypothetical protein
MTLDFQCRPPSIVEGGKEGLMWRHCGKVELQKDEE